MSARWRWDQVSDLSDWAATRMLVAELDRAWREQCEKERRESSQHPSVIRARLSVEWLSSLR